MKKPYKYGLLIIGGIWAATMAALSPQFVTAHRETKNVLQAFDGYSASLVSRHFEDAYQHCGTAFHNAMPYDQFVALQESLQTQFGALKSAKRTAFELHGSGTTMNWRAAINADLVYEKKTLRFRFVFHKEGEQWVLFGSEQI